MPRFKRYLAAAYFSAYIFAARRMGAAFCIHPAGGERMAVLSGLICWCRLDLPACQMNAVLDLFEYRTESYRVWRMAGRLTQGLQTAHTATRARARENASYIIRINARP